MGIVRMGCPEDFIIQLKEKFEIEEFVETGTYKGHTSIWASKNFNSVKTIENSQIIFDKYSKKLTGYQNIERLFGNSADVIKKVANKSKIQLFWLDAHWCGGDTFGTEDECPLIEELETIKEMAHPESIILIDDARLFMAPPPLPHNSKDWPTLHDIFDCVSTHYFSAVFDDVIFAANKRNKEVYVDIIQQYQTVQFNIQKRNQKRLISKVAKYSSLAMKKLSN
jgi:hypothetical protein